MEVNYENNMVSDGEYTNASVPKSERRNFGQLVFVWIGYVFTVTIMTAGGNIALGSYNVSQALSAIAVAIIFLIVLGSIIALISVKTGLTFGLLSRYTFGSKGSDVVSLSVMITLLGWFSINCYIVGSVTNVLFPSIPIIPVSLIAGILMTYTALKGLEIMNKLGLVATILVVVMGVVSIFLAIKDIGGLKALSSVTNQNNIMPFNDIVSIAIGSLVSGAICWTPDVMRYARSKGTATAVMIVAIGICAPFMLIIGTIGMLVYRESDIAYILKAQGLIAPAWFALVANVWSTAQGNVYSSSLNLSSIFTTVPRKKLVILFGGVGTIMGFLGIYRYFGIWLSFLAAIFPAIGGVIIADYFITYRDGYYPLKSVKLPKYIYFSFISVACGILSKFVFNFGLSAINGLIVSFIVQAILSTLFIKKEIKKLNKNVDIAAPVV